MGAASLPKTRAVSKGAHCVVQPFPAIPASSWSSLEKRADFLLRRSLQDGLRGDPRAGVGQVQSGSRRSRTSLSCALAPGQQPRARQEAQRGREAGRGVPGAAGHSELRRPGQAAETRLRRRRTHLSGVGTHLTAQGQQSARSPAI